MRYYADFIEEYYQGPRQPFFDTDIFYYGEDDLEVLFDACSRAAAETRDNTYVILDRHLRTIATFGWARRVRERAPIRLGPLQSAHGLARWLTRTAAQMLDLARDHCHPDSRHKLFAAAERIRFGRYYWLVVTALAQTSGYWGSEYVGVPAPRIRLLGPIMLPALDVLGRAVTAMARQPPLDQGRIPF